MRLSLIVGVAMLGGKTFAYAITGSAAITSDAAESIIHVIAVAFAAFSLWLSARPANARFNYGYERIAFFSAVIWVNFSCVSGATSVRRRVKKALPALMQSAGVLIVTAGAACGAGEGAGD